MTIKEQYKLIFSKMKMEGFSDSFMCTGSSYVNGSLQLATLLRALSDKEPDGLLEEVNLALTGGDYEEYYSIDMSSVDTIRMIPPNAIINNSFSISLIDLKQILEEWIYFINQY